MPESRQCFVHCCHDCTSVGLPGLLKAICGETDTSDKGLGAVLSQKQDGKVGVEVSRM